jgi:hypothetical protein
VQTRDLSEREAEVLAFLLEPEFPGVEALRRQAATARVAGRCPCGCASVLLATDPAAAAAEGEWVMVAVAASGRPRDDDPLPPDLLLTVLDGRLCELEINSYGETVFDVFPAPEEFEAPVPQSRADRARRRFSFFSLRRS